MDSIFVFVIIIIAILLLLLIINRNTDNKNINENTNDNMNTQFYQDSKINSYSLLGNEDEYKNKIEGYQNELMYENNLKDGDYSKQFTEIDFSRIPKSNIQVGFNPQPRDSSEIKLPYANINVNCL